MLFFNIFMIVVLCVLSYFILIPFEVFLCNGNEVFREVHFEWNGEKVHQRVIESDFKIQFFSLGKTAGTAFLRLCFVLYHLFFVGIFCYGLILLFPNTSTEILMFLRIYGIILLVVIVMLLVNMFIKYRKEKAAGEY